MYWDFHKKIFDAEQPERALRLNLRAQLQLLRANGIPVARTHASDLVDDNIDDNNAHLDKLDVKINRDTADDKAIFDRSGTNLVGNWTWIDVIGLGDADEQGTGKTAAEQVEDGEELMKGELEPSEQPVNATPVAVVDTAA
ncbi:phospholipase A2 [Beauveria bassiana ARSEF 2860]|uniref:Phospholipase A2 n=1 Tax=Beauveria bassiana (strain ARSEF 2860) TaxID=655819 RepID=J4UT52_BEAB2|nr:phospholipase A2 [Beauveria bassiana ARSEF 2860]EJP68952.1 phospholipase A2 [Beauveria bassiana ARSEF 2860]